MRRNVEIKARVRDEAAFALAVRRLAGHEPEVIRQDDLFFRVPAGRLKLRRFSAARGELIFYERDDAAGPETSRYVIVDTTDPEALATAIGGALGVRGRVIKTRRLYRVGRARVHLDRVEALGTFMELEVVLEDAEPVASGRREALSLMDALDVHEDDLVRTAYIDLLEEA